MIEDLRFLVADIDGTLVNEKRDMLDLTRRVLTDLHNRGVYLGIASGRPLGEKIYAMARNSWGLDFDFDCFIGMNGGQLKDDLFDTTDEFFKLQPDVIKEILELMEGCGVFANPFIYIGEDMLSRDKDEMMVAAMNRHHIQCNTVKDMSEFWKEPTAKILFRLKSPEDMPVLEKYLAEHRSDNFVFFKTQTTMMEFQDARVNKGIAVDKFVRDHELSMDQVMAFGDMTNDNEMLKIAGWGVCLKQGSEDTKACADVLTDYTNEEDGFGRYMIDHWYKPHGWQLPQE